jgi:hypothetical protein
MRAVRVYQLVITYPEGSQRPGWRPAGWSDPQFLATLSHRQRRQLARAEFSWPAERRFLSASGAEGRANLLRWYGAGVSVYASDPVTWPEQDDADPRDARGWDDPSKAMRWSPGHPLLADALDRLRTEELLASLENAS